MELLNVVLSLLTLGASIATLIAVRLTTNKRPQRVEASESKRASARQ